MWKGSVVIEDWLSCCYGMSPTTRPISCNAISTKHLLLCNSRVHLNPFLLPVPEEMQLLRPASIDDLMRRSNGYDNKKWKAPTMLCVHNKKAFKDRRPHTTMPVLLATAGSGVCWNGSSALVSLPMLETNCWFLLQDLHFSGASHPEAPGFICSITSG